MYNKLANEAADFAKNMIFSFDGSKPSGDVVSFFDSLIIDPQLRWDVFVSSEYLTLSLLVDNLSDTRYDSSIDSVFRNESTDEEIVSPAQDHGPRISVNHRSDIKSVKDLSKRSVLRTSVLRIQIQNLYWGELYLDTGGQLNDHIFITRSRRLKKQTFFSVLYVTRFVNLVVG